MSLSLSKEKNLSVLLLKNSLSYFFFVSYSPFSFELDLSKLKINSFKNNVHEHEILVSASNIEGDNSPTYTGGGGMRHEILVSKSNVEGGTTF